MKKHLFVTFVVVLLLGVASQGRAGFAFDHANGKIAGNTSVTSPYASVSITGNTLTGVVTFDVTVVNGNAAKLGAISFNLAKGVSASDFSDKVASFSGTGGNTSTWGLESGKNISGFGKFDLRVGPSSNAKDDRLTSYEFTLQFAPGEFDDAVASNFDVLNGTKKKPGYDFALKYFPTTGKTGFVASVGDTYVPPSDGTSPAGDPVAAPEPSTGVLMMLGLACVGLVCWKRQRLTPASA